MPASSRKPTARRSSAPRTPSRRAAGKIRYAFRYLLTLPEGYHRDRQRWPIVFFFHGRGERGKNLVRVRRHGPPKLVAQGHAFPFILVSPQCEPSDYWWNYRALEAFVDDLVHQLHVDRDRVYLTGLSMGGFATWALAEQAPERYAAIAPVCGGGDSRLAARLGNLPVWAFHGRDDPTIPARRTTEMLKAIRAVGGSPRGTLYPGVGHDSWTRTYENPALYAWLLAQRRKQR